MSERMEFRDWSTDAVEKLQAQEAEIERLWTMAWEMATRAGERDAEIERLRAAGTAMLNATTAEELIKAEGVWHELMGWDEGSDQ
jgi:hypothetical protein